MEVYRNILFIMMNDEKLFAWKIGEFDYTYAM